MGPNNFPTRLFEVKESKMRSSVPKVDVLPSRQNDYTIEKYVDYVVYQQTNLSVFKQNMFLNLS